MSSPSGLVIVDKPAAITSHQVVGKLRRLLGTRKIGHAGTLDPMATGVLILGVNRATRMLGHLALHDKQYLATIRLGESSDSDDADGVITVVGDASRLTLEQIDGALDSQRGQIMQVPSTVSAIKVNGKRAYALARAGEEVELKSRAVTVSELLVLRAVPNAKTLDVAVSVTCSSGTYIRAIARDLGRTLGVGGHLISLQRTRIGNYRLEDAQVVGDSAPKLMSMADAARLSFPVVEVDIQQEADVRHGRALTLAVTSTPTGLVSQSGELLALYQPAESGSKPLAVLV